MKRVCNRELFSGLQGAKYDAQPTSLTKVQFTFTLNRLAEGWEFQALKVKSELNVHFFGVIFATRSHVRLTVERAT
jgi:hypothetical protein